MNVTKGPKNQESVLMFVIGGNEPRAEFTRESLEELDRTGMWPEGGAKGPRVAKNGAAKKRPAKRGKR